MFRRSPLRTEDLHRVPLFAGCSARELRRVASLTTPIAFDAGEVLMVEGRPAGECFVIAAGTVRVSCGDVDLAELGSGEIVGELALLAPGLRSATATATTPVRTYVMTPAELEALLLDVPTVRRKIVAIVARRCRPRGMPVPS